MARPKNSLDNGWGKVISNLITSGWIAQYIPSRTLGVGANPLALNLLIGGDDDGLPGSTHSQSRTNESLRINACFEGARSAQWLAPKLLCRKKSGAARNILASTLQASVILAGCAGKSPALSAPFSTGDCRQHHSKEQALRVLQEKKGGVP